MLYREIIAVCSEIHTKHVNTLCGQNVELLSVKPGCTHSNHWAIQIWCTLQNNDKRCTKFFICIVFLLWCHLLRFGTNIGVTCIIKLGAAGGRGSANGCKWTMGFRTKLQREGRFIWIIPWYACVPFHHCHPSSFYLPLFIPVAQKIIFLRKNIGGGGLFALPKLRLWVPTL
jgi:hypothetical protein